MKNSKTSPFLKLGLDLGPLLIFFAAYRFSDVFVATGVFMASMVVAMVLSKKIEGKIAPMLWVTFVIVMVMGSLTLYFNDETFVKLKPTLVNAIFGTLLLFGFLTGKSLLKTVMGQAFPPMADKGWELMTRNWIIFFYTMAILNEYVWRTQTTDTWITIKTFGYLPLTFIFILFQTPIISKYQQITDK